MNEQASVYSFPIKGYFLSVIFSFCVLFIFCVLVSLLCFLRPYYFQLKHDPTKKSIKKKNIYKKNISSFSVLKYTVVSVCFFISVFYFVASVILLTPSRPLT